MTLVFVDSVAHYSLAQVTRKYEFGSPAAIVAGRFPGSFAAQGGVLKKTVPALATYGFGCAVQASSVGSGPIADVRDTDTCQVNLSFLADGRLAVQNGRFGGGGVYLGSSPAALRSGVWYYIEMLVTVDPAVGTVVVRVNGATVINLVGQNTRATATSQITQVNFGSGPFDGTACAFSDIYILNTLGAVNNALLGDVRVQALFPTAPGNYTEFGTLIGAATQWQATADNPADDDVSYIGSAVAAQRSTFATLDLTPTSGTVAGVVINHTTRKDDAGVRTVAGMARLAAVDAAGAGVNVGNGFAIYQEIMEANPSAAPWTIANVNAAEFGVKEIA